MIICIKCEQHLEQHCWWKLKLKTCHSNHQRQCSILIFLFQNDKIFLNNYLSWMVWKSILKKILFFCLFVFVVGWIEKIIPKTLFEINIWRYALFKDWKSTMFMNFHEICPLVRRLVMNSMETCQYHGKLKSTSQNIIMKWILHTPSKRIFSSQKGPPTGATRVGWTTMWSLRTLRVKACRPYLLIFLTQTLVFEWSMVRCGSGYRKHMCMKEIGVRAQNLLIIVWAT